MKFIIPLLLVGIAMTIAATDVAAAPSCPSSWPSPVPDDSSRAYGLSYEGFFTDSEGQRWFVILSLDNNGYTTGRAYVADDRYELGYVPGEAGISVLYRLARIWHNRP